MVPNRFYAQYSDQKIGFMSKVLDWSEIAQVNFDDKRRKAQGIMTGKELFQKAYQQLEAQEEHKKYRAHVEPILKAELINYMASRTPIKVIKPIQNPTEVISSADLGDEDDGFYQNVAKSSHTETPKFREVMETIPAGVELVYKAWDKQLGQWLFKGSNGREYAIYDKSVIIYQGSGIENPGLFGLLYNTNISEKLGE